MKHVLMNPLLIFGASTRAAAFSAIRAGFNPICGDLFADADLRAFASVLSVPDYPHHLADVAGHLPKDIPWIFTGALENSPAEVDRLSLRHPLWGNPASVLRNCRDPWKCSAALDKAGLPTIELRSSATPPPRDERWLMKPLRSSAGRAITLWSTETRPLPEPHYFQRFVEGTSISGAYLATPAGTQLLGVSQQLIGSAELHAPGFGYCGSIYPSPLLRQMESLSRAAACDELIEVIGSTISREFGLRGLFGIDFIHDGCQVWMTEINPRYTASMELIEHSRQLPLLRLQQTACEESSAVSIPDRCTEPQGPFCAKVILYADRNARVPDLSSWIPRQITLAELPSLADIPATGSPIHQGQPVLTCLGTGADPDGLLQGLANQAQELWKSFPK